EGSIPLSLRLRKARFGCLGLKVGGGLFNRRVLQRVSGAQTGQRRCALVEDRFGMFGGSADVAIIETDQHLSGVHSLIVGDQNLRDESGDGRSNRGNVPADVGIVGALDETARGPPVMAVAGP